MLQSLALTDIIQLIGICAIIFTLSGIFIHKNYSKFIFVLRFFSKFSSNLKDSGTFREFISNKSPKQ